MSSIQNEAIDACEEQSYVPGLVSIVIPCYRGEKFLAEAIQSCLDQTYRFIEVIAVDDASPGACAAIADRFASTDPRVRVVRRAQNGGVSRAFNAGFEIARGEYFARLAQDDVFEPDAIAAMVDHLQSHPGCGLVYGDLTVCDESGSVLDVQRVPEPAMALAIRNQVGLCVMWPRWTWDSVGGFDPSFDAAEDYEYWLRIAHHFPIDKLTGPPRLRVRYHEAMGSLQQLLVQNERSRRAIMKWLCPPGRRRTASGRIALAYADYASAFGLSERGHAVASLSKMIRSFASWPLPLPSSADAIPFGRARLFMATLLRIIGIRRPSRRGEQCACEAGSGAATGAQA